MATVSAVPQTQVRSLTGVRRWAWATLAFFVLVVLEGAVVRATSSGAGCGAHWPLCNNEIFPHHPKLTTVIEFTHRSLTGVSTLMFAVLIGWTFYATPPRHRARRTAVAAGVLLLLEAALGAVIVLRRLVEQDASGLRVLVQSVHFTNTLLLLAATAATARLLERRFTLLPEKTGAIRRVMLLALAAVVITGATGSVAALADTLFPSPDLHTALLADFAAHSPLLIRMRWVHPAAAVVATCATVWLARAARLSGWVSVAGLLLGSVAVQLLLGVLDVLLLAPLWLQVLHLLSADLFWLLLVWLATPLLANWRAPQTAVSLA